MTIGPTDQRTHRRADLLDRLAQPCLRSGRHRRGATGLGVALDAAACGFSVVLVDSRLCQGNVVAHHQAGARRRSLSGTGQHLLVREALHERTTLLHNAPHLAQPLAFVMPSPIAVWETPFYGIGLTMYDALAGQAGLGCTQFLGAERTAAVPCHRVRNGLRAGSSTGTASSTTPAWPWRWPARRRQRRSAGQLLPARAGAPGRRGDWFACEDAETGRSSLCGPAAW